jgi:hypothetical protein
MAAPREEADRHDYHARKQPSRPADRKKSSKAGLLLALGGIVGLFLVCGVCGGVGIFALGLHRRDDPSKQVQGIVQGARGSTDREAVARKDESKADKGSKTQPPEQDQEVAGKGRPPAVKTDPGLPEKKGDPGKSSGLPTPTGDLLKGKADFTLDADTWQAEWEKDKKAAKEKYKGKIVELSGVVDRANDDPYLKNGYIYLKLKKSLFGLRCTLDDLAPWLTVAPGCTIMLKGIASDIYSDGQLYPCVIIQSSPNTCLEITASQLAKEFTKDKDAAVKKFHDKRLIVEGELASKEPSKLDKGQFIYLTLKGDGAVSVRCYVANNTSDRQQANDSLKVGQKLKVCGEADIDVNAKVATISSPGARMVTLVR